MIAPATAIMTMSSRLTSRSYVVAKFTDDQLCRMPLDDLATFVHHQRDERAVEVLLERLAMLVERAAAEFRHVADVDDLKQEASLAILTAVDRFDPERGHFVPLVRVVIRRQLIGYLRRQRPGPRLVGGDKAMHLAELVQSHQGGPFEQVAEQDEYDHLAGQLWSRLSPYEGHVLSLFLLGVDHAAIARTWGTTPKSVGGALTRIRRKAAAIDAAANQKQEK